MNDTTTTVAPAPKAAAGHTHVHGEACCDHDHGHDHHHHHHAPVATYHRAAPKVGRNDACPCGSGKKYKKCCLAHERA